MRGHFETDRSVLKRTVQWEEWLADAEADLALAQKLGGKVVLMGHSTGALLLTWLAIRNPEKIAGLILDRPPTSFAEEDGQIGGSSAAWNDGPPQTPL
jgi:pimeloyl-ACP methyl ester carboxylesterase